MLTAENLFIIFMICCGLGLLILGIVIVVKIIKKIPKKKVVEIKLKPINTQTEVDLDELKELFRHTQERNEAQKKVANIKNPKPSKPAPLGEISEITKENLDSLNATPKANTNSRDDFDFTPMQTKGEKVSSKSIRKRLKNMDDETKALLMLDILKKKS